MRVKITLAGVVVLALFALTFYGCGGAEDNSPEAKATRTNTKSQAKVETVQAYPIDYCIVSGEKLGKMDEIVEYDYQGRTVKFCCKSCVKKFKADPAFYLAKLDSAATGQPDAHEGHDHGS